MKILKSILVSVVLGVWSAVVCAAPPYVNYQGQLNGADGQPLPTGNYTMQFNIYDQAQLGARVWGPFVFDGAVATGHGPLVPVVNGRFNVIIGPQDTNTNSISAAFGGTNRFMEIMVGDGPAILPRQQFLSTAYAFEAINSKYAEQAGSLVQAVADALSPPGSIIAFGGPTNRIPSGWLLCDGRLFASNSFPRLYNVISNAWGGTGTNFNLPDLRGMFLRGVNLGRTDGLQDPGSTARGPSATGGLAGNNAGSVQASQFRPHKHRWAEIDGNASRYYRSLYSWDVNGVGFQALRPFVAGDDGTSGDDDSFEVVAPANAALYTKSGATVDEAGETRPNNAYVNYIIKY